MDADSVWKSVLLFMYNLKLTNKMTVVSKSDEEVILSRAKNMSQSMRELDVLMHLAEQLLWSEKSINLKYISPSEGSYKEAKQELVSRVGEEGKIIDADHIDDYDLVFGGKRDIYIEAKGHTSRTGPHFQKGYSQCILNGNSSLHETDEYALAIPADAINVLWDKWTTSNGDIPWGTAVQMDKADDVGANLSIYLVINNYHLKVGWSEFFDHDLSKKDCVESLEVFIDM